MSASASFCASSRRSGSAWKAHACYPAWAPELEGPDLVGPPSRPTKPAATATTSLPAPDGRVGIAVGDVSGHGVGAALPTAEARAYLRSLSKTTTDLGEILRQLNLLLCHDTEGARFVTLTAPVHRHLSRGRWQDVTEEEQAPASEWGV
jgi:hypothetical protein